MLALTALVATFLLATPTAAHAATTAGLTGTVKNDAGQPVSGATVVLDNLQGVQETTVTTQDDGSYTVAVPDDVAAGSYRLEVEDTSDTSSMWYGGTTFQTAKNIKLTASTLTKANVTVPRTGTLKVNVHYLDVPSGYAPFAVFYFFNGNRTYDGYGAELDPSTYTVKAVDRGTYYLQVVGYAATPAGGGTAAELHFVPRYFGSYLLDSAKPIVIRPGRTTRVSVTVTRRLSALTKPSISGTAEPGHRLYAHHGLWSMRVGLRYAYTWRRNGHVVSHANSYRLARNDRGDRVQLTVTARDSGKQYLPGTARSRTVRVAG